MAQYSPKPPAPTSYVVRDEDFPFVLQVVASATGVPTWEILGNSLTRRATNARHTLYFVLANALPLWNVKRIADRTWKNPKSVLAGIRSIRQDPERRAEARKVVAIYRDLKQYDPL